MSGTGTSKEEPRGGVAGDLSSEELPPLRQRKQTRGRLILCHGPCVTHGVFIRDSTRGRVGLVPGPVKSRV